MEAGNSGTSLRWIKVTVPIPTPSGCVLRLGFKSLDTTLLPIGLPLDVLHCYTPGTKEPDSTVCKMGKRRTERETDSSHLPSPPLFRSRTPFRWDIYFNWWHHHHLWAESCHLAQALSQWNWNSLYIKHLGHECPGMVTVKDHIYSKPDPMCFPFVM